MILSLTLTVGNAKKYIYIFQDENKKKQSELMYMKKKEAYYEGYDLTNFFEKEKRFGMHFLYSNLNIEAEDVYLSYKARWRIEECFDYLKNTLDLGTVYQRSNEKTEAWAFLNHISKVKVNDAWYTSEISKTDREIFDAMGIEL